MGDANEPATLGELVHRYLLERRKRGELTVHTWRMHNCVLSQFAVIMGNRTVRQLSRRDIDRWLGEIGHLAAATRRNRVSILRGFCDWLVEHRHKTSNPMAGLRAPRVPRSVPRALPWDAVADTLAAAPDERARLIIILMVQQGLRRAEVAGLQLGDMDPTNRQMRVIGKGGHERFVWITDETIVELGAYLNQYPAREGPLVRSYVHPHEGISPTMVGRIVQTALYAAGVKHQAHDGISGHALRHTAATDMLRHGAHVRDVQAVLGHSNLATTERYLPRMVSTLEAAMEGRSYT